MRVGYFQHLNATIHVKDVIRTIPITVQIVLQMQLSLSSFRSILLQHNHVLTNALMGILQMDLRNPKHVLLVTVNVLNVTNKIKMETHSNVLSAQQLIHSFTLQLLLASRNATMVNISARPKSVAIVSPLVKHV